MQRVAADELRDRCRCVATSLMKRRLLHLFRRHVPEPIRAPFRTLVQRSRSRPVGEAPQLSVGPDGNVVLETAYGPPVTLVPAAIE